MSGLEILALKCNNTILVRGFDLFFLATTVTFVFIFFQVPPVANWFASYIPDEVYRLLTISLLFFVIIYLLDRLMVYLRPQLNACPYRIISLTH